jgi:phosphoglycerate dehydrogenase-like enzyme
LQSIAKVSYKNLKFIQLLSAGYDHLNFDMFPGECIIASNQGAYAEPMAEHSVAMILALEKLLLINHNKMIGGEFDQRTNTRTLRGKICGIIGFGSIGKATANLLKGFGVKIYGINSSGKTEEKIDFIGTLTDLNYVLKESDIIIISIPLNEITRGLIGKKEFDLMKDDAVFINVARGAIVQEEALYEHLKTHPNFMAGIDAWWYEPFNYGEFKLTYPFFELPNVLGSPHNSAIIPGALIEGQRRAIDNISNFLKGEKLKGIIKR